MPRAAACVLFFLALAGSAWAEGGGPTSDAPAQPSDGSTTPTPPPPAEPPPAEPPPAQPPPAQPPPAPSDVPRAVRVEHAPRIDGHLEDPAWAAAPVFDAFVLNEPTEGGSGSERTELRVVFDDRNLYLSFHCFDSRPEEIHRPLARRDSEPAADFIVVFLSPQNDRRTARRFVVNAGGVQADTIQYDDTSSSQSWDAVWQAQVAHDALGWSAELAIPLYVLGGFDGPQPSWGFLARRYIARTHEKVSSILIPRGSNGFVSRMGILAGVDTIGPRRALEILPYLAARSTIRPKSSDPTMPTPREGLVAGDLGVDLSLGLPRGLLVNATINPDFGQVEADDIVLNLSTFETFYPEKRPFFTNGLDLFQPVGGGEFSQAQNLFYSRRIGRTAPILGALKLTGSPLPGFSIGLLDAVVTPDRILHLESDEENPSAAGETTNYLAAVARAALGRDSWVGARFAAATPGGNAGALDTTVKTPDGDWAVYGQLAVSQVTGGRPARTLADGTVVENGDAGMGGYLRAGKLGGAPYQVVLGYEYESPKLDLNAVGFQRNQNQHDFKLTPGVFEPNGLGPLLYFDTTLRVDAAFTSDGRWLARNREVGIDINATLPGFHNVNLDTSYNAPAYDVRELRGSGVVLGSPGSEWLTLGFSSDSSRLLSLFANGTLGHWNAVGAVAERWYWSLEGGATLRPSPSFETLLSAKANRNDFGPRYLETLEDGRFLLGRLDNLSLSVTLRQQWAITRDLTLQAYVQLFNAFAVYGPFYEGSGTPDSPVEQRDLVAAAAPMTVPDFHTTEVLVNVILRWEYRPGATLYLVYSRDQNELPGERAEASLGSRGLWRGPVIDALSLKWTWFWSG